MCGIIGVTGNANATQLIVEGLKRLEYRGYDSAGVATNAGGRLNRVRAEGKIKNLDDALQKNSISGKTGIGHTRWATHGAPSEKNAHPHATEKVAVVHNGIIENYLSIREKLIKAGYQFHSETDTEVIPILITSYLDKGLSKKEAVIKAIAELEGAYAIGIIFSDEEDLIYATRHGAPLVVGYNKHEKYIASDALALGNLTSEICYLEEGDIAEITSEKVIIMNKEGEKVKRKISRSNLASINIGKENYDHFMQKEIFEQPAVIGDNLHAYFNPLGNEIMMPQIPFSFKDIEKITLVACGTSYYAARVASYWLEKIAGIAVSTDVASEFRYRSAVLPKNGLTILISQSGETADTLAALKYAKSRGQKIISIVNVVQSSIARESDVVLPIYSGPEIGVASTKAFTTQLMTLAFLTLKIAREKNIAGAKELTKSLLQVPALMSEVLLKDKAIKHIAHEIAKARDIMYIGRGVSYPVAMEGALKLKEISYIHSEATAAGELKHGPIALIDKNVPVVAIAPSDELFEKTASNIREVAARGGKIILLSDEKGISQLKDVVEHSVEMPATSNGARDIINPMLYSLPIQLLAYHVAVYKGTDVDQPRNLAKSVTVE